MSMVVRSLRISSWLLVLFRVPERRLRNVCASWLFLCGFPAWWCLVVLAKPIPKADISPAQHTTNSTPTGVQRPTSLPPLSLRHPATWLPMWMWDRVIGQTAIAA
jgi:hypothetical protein